MKRMKRSGAERSGAKRMKRSGAERSGAERSRQDRKDFYPPNLSALSDLYTAIHRYFIHRYYTIQLYIVIQYKTYTTPL